MPGESVTPPLRLGVLDQSPVSEGSTGAEALANTLDLARLADDLGYHRYWVAEHHGTPMLASTSPEVLIGPIASATSRIRVGAGGVILHHYSPRKVAESFSVLSGLFADRIDLGLGRGMSADATTTFALQRDRRAPAPGDFLNPNGAEMARLYREFFAASERLERPRLAVAVSAICADTDDEAERLAASARMCSAVQS